jgi:hypothetical protein
MSYVDQLFGLKGKTCLYAAHHCLKMSADEVESRELPVVSVLEWL